MVLDDTRVRLNDFLPEGLQEHWSIKLTGLLTVDKSMPFELGLAVAGDCFSTLLSTQFYVEYSSGRAKLWINNKLTIDNWTKQRPGDFFYG